jgi:hypothetical protein
VLSPLAIVTMAALPSDVTPMASDGASSDSTHLGC